MKIGVVMMLVDLLHPKRAMTFAELRSMAQQAAQVGIDSIWVYDHLLYRMKPGDIKALRKLIGNTITDLEQRGETLVLQ